MTREQLIRIARDCVPVHEVNPMTYDPPEWMLKALQRAYDTALRDSGSAMAKVERAAYDRGYSDGERDGRSAASNLYPEGG